MPSSDPLVSILIPFYNCPYVTQAIESALNQTYPFIEVIVVNDGSTKHQDLIKPYLSRVVYIEKTNNGVASALNQGIQQAKGDYFVWLSSDDMIDPHKVEYQLRFMQERNYSISFTNFNYIDKNSQITKYNIGIHFQNDLEVLKFLQCSNPINGCTVMMSRKVVEATGYFNENLKCAQDYEYWIRASLHFTVHYIPITLTNYRVHEEMGTIRHSKEALEEFNAVKDKYSQIIDTLIKKLEQSK